MKLSQKKGSLGFPFFIPLGHPYSLAQSLTKEVGLEGGVCFS
tara:strand:- start:1911 stop:2036 length:126 start_codon:yes stop_codon:yes gene_type:complete